MILGRSFHLKPRQLDSFRLNTDFCSSIWYLFAELSHCVVRHRYNCAMALLGMSCILQRLLSLLFIKGALGLIRIITSSQVFISRSLWSSGFFKVLFFFFFCIFMCKEILEMRTNYVYLYCIYHSVRSSFAQNQSITRTYYRLQKFSLIPVFFLAMHLHRKQALQLATLLTILWFK